MYDTPRTDAKVLKWQSQLKAPELWEVIEHARQLEREWNAAKAEIDQLRSGIVGKLVEAGTLEGMDGFHGLLIEVPVEDLRKAASVPLYRRVLITDASLT